MTLDELKLYLRVDANDDDTLIQSFMTAASSYINQQTGKTKIVTSYDAQGLPITADITTDELYNLCIKIMVAHWYENRVVEAASRTLSKVSHSVDALVHHIAMCGDYR